jgi:hypothetical protein
MANNQLVQYIIDNTKAGFTRTDIEKALVDAGWTVPDIAAAFAAIVTGATPAPAAAAPQPLTPAQAVEQKQQVAAAVVQTQASATSGADFVAEMARRREASAVAPVQTAAAVPIDAGFSAPGKFPVPGGSTTETGIVGFLIKRGIVKNTQQANIVLIAVLVIVVGLTIYVMLPKSSAPVVPPNVIPKTPAAAAQ